MVIMLFQFILAHNCVGGRFPLVVITLVLNGTKFSWAGFFPLDLNLCFGGTNPPSQGLLSASAFGGTQLQLSAICP